MTRNREPQLVGSEQLARLLETAAASARKRSHLLLHADHHDPVQRLLIGLEPESYVRAHVHSEQWEMIVLLRGRFDFLIFNPQAELVQRLAMSVASPVAQIPRGTWHSGVALAPETLVLEVKPGPYRPNEFAPWAPEEGEPASSAFVHWAAGASLEADGAPTIPDRRCAGDRRACIIAGVAALGSVPAGGAGSQQYGKNSQTPAMPGGTPRLKRR